MGKKKIGKYHYPDGDQLARIEKAFQVLGFGASAGSFEQLAIINHEKHGTIYDYLERLLQLEFKDKEEARVNRWIAQSKIKELKTIGDFDFSKQPSIDPALISELSTCRFIKNGHNVVFLGPAGVGKTHLATALGVRAIDQGFEMRFMPLNEFQDAIKRYAETSIKRLYSSLVRPDLLILDDIDYYNVDEESSKFLFDVIKKRYEDNKSLSITSNRNPKDWGDLFGTSARTHAALDRIFDTSRAKVINITGESYRLPKTDRSTLLS